MLPRPAWVLFFGTFLNKFGAFVVPFLTLYLTTRGYSVAVAGIAVGAYGVGHFAASLLGGFLADTLGRRKTIVLSMFTGAATMLLLSQARDVVVIVALTALTGLANECYRPASSALLTDLVPPSQRVISFAALRMSFNAGFAFGPAMAGLLAGLGYFWLFAGDALTSVLFGIVALLALPRGAGETRIDNTSWSELLKTVRRDKRFLQLLLANFCIALVFFQMASTFGLYVTGLGFSPAVYGAVISLNGVLVVFCELPLVTISRRFPARRVMAAGYVITAAGFALNGLAHSVPALVLCMVIFTFGEMMIMPVSAAYVANLAPAHMRGRYMGVSGLTWALALILGPALGMKLYSLGHGIYWMSGGAMGLIACAVVLGKPRDEMAMNPLVANAE